MSLSRKLLRYTLAIGSVLMFRSVATAQRNVAVPTDPTANAPSTERVLSAPVKRVVFDGTPFSIGATVPHWENGYLISTALATGPGIPNVRLFDRNGNKVREVSIWMPESQRTAIEGSTVAPDGTIVVSGTAVRADGTRAGFIARTTASGLLSDVIQTNPFWGTQVCIAPDRTVWSFGGLERGLDESRPTGDLLRHYDFRKGLIGSFIPDALFDPSLGNAGVPTGNGGEVYMRCSNNLVAILSNPVSQYILVDPRTGGSKQFSLPTLRRGVALHGFAVTGTGEAYAVLMNLTAKKVGLFHLDLDPSTAQTSWVPVAGAIGNTGGTGAVDWLWGADGNYLVYGVTGDPSANSGVLWAAAP